MVVLLVVVLRLVIQLVRYVADRQDNLFLEHELVVDIMLTSIINFDMIPIWYSSTDFRMQCLLASTHLLVIS